jgi:hypothetical protein
MAIGDKGEQDFKQYYAHLGPVKSEDRAIDFILADGTTVELKSDSYPMEKTENFFMETLSDTKSGKLGGVFRARNDKIHFFVYYYPANKTFFWFEVEKLCAEVERLIGTGKYRVKSIKNRSWTTEGYALSRSLFEKVMLRKDVFP